MKLRLVRGAGGERIWTGSWTLAIDADFAARDAITARIVDDVQQALLAHRETGRQHEVTESVSISEPAVEPVDERARDLVDRGRYLMRYGTVDAYPQALQRFRAAAAIAPRYAAAHFGIAAACHTCSA